jgi:hypothetical protein
MFDRATIVGVCVPIMCRGTSEACEKESKTCSASGGCCCRGRTPLAAACRGLAGWAAPPVVRENLAATAVESIRKSWEKVGYKGERERRVLMAEDSDTKLRIIRKLNLLVSQAFLYICVGQCTIVMVKVTTQE